MRFGGLTIVMLVAVLACTKPEGPALCSTEGQARLKEAGAGQDVLAKTCPQQRPQEGPQQKGDADGGQPQETQPTTWKVQPTPLSVIKADPPSYIEKPTLVFVAIKPSDYFNYGYSRARDSYFAFRLRSILPDGHLGPDEINGYAARTWARPFFDAVTKNLSGSQYEFTTATLVVTYLKRRYDGHSADHIEILAAEGGERFDMDPAAVKEAAPASRASAAGAERKCRPSPRSPDVEPIHVLAKVRVSSLSRNMYRMRNEENGGRLRLKTRGCEVQAANEAATLETCVADLFRMRQEPPMYWGNDGNWSDIKFSDGTRCPVAATLGQR